MKAEDITIDLMAAFRAIPLFTDLPDEAIGQIIAFSRREDCYRGQTIIEEGDPGDDMVILLSGRVGVQMESINPHMEIAISRLGAGEVIGEMALLDDSPRSATIVALEACAIVRVPSEHLNLVFMEHPEWGMLFMRNLAASLSERLRMMNRRLLNMIRARYFNS